MHAAKVWMLIKSYSNYFVVHVEVEYILYILSINVLYISAYTNLYRVAVNILLNHVGGNNIIFIVRCHLT